MTRYFFHVHDDDGFPDLQGTELTDLNAAREEAIRFSGTLLREQPDKFWTSKRWELEVCDDHGLRLFTLSFFAEEAPSAQAVPYQASNTI